MKPFLIRRISTTADGREIVRDAPATRDLVLVGRAATNDIALPDLGVDPEHLQIEHSSDGRVLVTATGSNGFLVGRRRRKQAVIDPDQGGDIGLGGHRITMTRDVGGEIVLTVQRIAAISKAAEERDETKAFSLRGLIPAKRGTAWALAIAVLIGFLAIPVWAAFQKQHHDARTIYAAKSDTSWSSGPLSQAHHALEGNCEACHKKAFVSVRDETCQSCHKDVHDHAPPARLGKARATPGFGGQILVNVAKAFGKEGPGSCVACHTEHEGAGPMPATAQAFCSDCHGTLNQRLTDTKLPNAADFGTEHPQFRPLIAMVPGAKPVMVRASLDTKPMDDSGLKFTHKLHLDARGGVAAMARSLKGSKGYGDVLVCADCHTPTADRTRFLPVDMEKNCQACHSLAFDKVGGTTRTLRHGDTAQMIADLRAFYRSTSPARPINLGGMERRRPGIYAEGQTYSAYFGAVGARGSAGDAAVRAVFSPGGACYDCHLVKPPGAGAPDWSVVPVNQPMRYMMHGWFDHNAHATETCASCHAAAKSTKATDLLLPGLKSCRSCHGGEASAAKVPSSCAMCHSYHAKQDAPWKPQHDGAPSSPLLMVPKPGDTASLN
ncbi:cytochrome c3 family protein [Sphingomonas sp. 28-63-12]|uniref:cytochrome c3 family protein n=1 Tax=Sphingomonas sp. 28-63-12 TaxID=1970434 RepID=UPI000BDBBE25|nr:MAG: cytochrome C [Sphingomonas sp. 28-63-12]